MQSIPQFLSQVISTSSAPFLYSALIFSLILNIVLAVLLTFGKSNLRSLWFALILIGLFSIGVGLTYQLPKFEVSELAVIGSNNVQTQITNHKNQFPNLDDNVFPARDPNEHELKNTHEIVNAFLHRNNWEERLPLIIMVIS